MEEARSIDPILCAIVLVIAWVVVTNVGYAIAIIFKG